jgi:hypothetical protein
MIMTVASTVIGLLPILWGSGTGASVMKRIGAPMIGGMVTSTLLTLLVIPAVYSLWKEWGLRVTGEAWDVRRDGESRSERLRAGLVAPSTPASRSI